MKKNLSFGNKLFYGIGGLGYSSLSQTLGSFIMFFSTAVMGISGSLVGIAIATIYGGSMHDYNATIEYNNLSNSVILYPTITQTPIRAYFTVFYV